MNNQLEDLYKGCCDHEHGEVNLADDGIDDALRLLLIELYHTSGTDGTLNQVITKYFADKLWKGVTEGFGSDIGSLDYDTPDYNMLTKLKENVWHFSAAKNYAQLRELSDALLDGEGQLRTFEQFLDAAKPINERYMKTWLKTEYELAVAGGQMAGKWIDIEKNAETFPLIQFDVVMDNRTSDICRPLDRVIVPIDHPMVKRFYPPNHFGCRTTVRQLRTGKITPDDKIITPEIPAMFRTNLGQRGLIFPPGHAYFEGLPDSVKDSFKP